MHLDTDARCQQSIAITLSHATSQEQHGKLGLTLLQHPAKRIHHCLAIVASSFLHNQADTIQETCQQQTRAGTMGFQLFWVPSWLPFVKRCYLFSGQQDNVMHAKAEATGNQVMVTEITRLHLQDFVPSVWVHSSFRLLHQVLHNVACRVLLVCTRVSPGFTGVAAALLCPT